MLVKKKTGAPQAGLLLMVYWNYKEDTFSDSQVKKLKWKQTTFQLSSLPKKTRSLYVFLRAKQLPVSSYFGCSTIHHFQY